MEVLNFYNEIDHLPLPHRLNIDETELKIILAGERYERENLSLGQAAELAGLSKRTFIEVTGRYGFSLFTTSEEDLLSDMKKCIILSFVILAAL